MCFLHAPTGHMHAMGMASVLWLPLLFIVLALIGSGIPKRSQASLTNMFAKQARTNKGKALDADGWERWSVDELENGISCDSANQATCSNAQAGNNNPQAGSNIPQATPGSSSEQAGSNTPQATPGSSSAQAGSTPQATPGSSNAQAGNSNPQATSGSSSAQAGSNNPQATPGSSSTQAGSDPEPAPEPKKKKPLAGSNWSTKVKVTWVATWVKKYPWLYWDKEHQAARCSICVKQERKSSQGNRDNALYFGLKELKTTRLEEHEIQHASTTTINAGLQQSGAMDAICKEVKQSQLLGLMNLVTTLYWTLGAGVHSVRTFTSVVRDLLPTLTASSEASKQRGATEVVGTATVDLLHKKIDSGVSQPMYTSNKGASQLMLCISDIFQEELLQKMRESPYLAFIIDESCDVTTSEQLIIYVQYLVNDVEVFCDYFMIRRLTGVKAADIFAKVKEALDVKGVDPQKWVAGGMDGCSVMMGHKGGVSKLWKLKVQPYFIGHHCLSHRCAL